MTALTVVCCSMTSEIQILYGSRVARQGKRRAVFPYHSVRFRLNDVCRVIEQFKENVDKIALLSDGFGQPELNAGIIFACLPDDLRDIFSRVPPGIKKVQQDDNFRRA